MNRIAVIIIALLLIAVFVLSWLLFFKSTTPSTPGQETTQSTTTQPTSSSGDTVKPPLSAKVRVTSPVPGATVPKTFTVTGEAPGNWYFEASFPAQVRDPNGKILASIPAQAQSEWMTDAQVPFKAELTVANYSGPATLVLLKDNPSGLPENDDSVSYDIVIAK